ncbi:MAG: DegT/DnrJ/EryC1/StrS family aminotransferase [archaeon]
MEKIPVAEPVFLGNELKYVKDCIESGWVSSIGEYVNRFEEGFSKYIGTSHGVSTSNGTVALHLALSALGLGPGYEVLIPDMTFIATANAVTYTGAKPVLVDIEPDTWNMDPRKLEEKINDKTKAIIPVHIYGHPCDMDPITKVAKKYDLKVVEDAAEAHGAVYKEARVGSLSDISCFSFYGNKVITTGEGGICLTKDSGLAERLRFLKDHGMSKEKRYWHPEIGFNYRMTNIQAAIGLAQLENIDLMILRKRRNASLYNSLLKDVEGIALPPEMPWAKNVYWMYSILVDDNYKYSRDEVMDRLKVNGIDSRPFFYPLHQMPPYFSNEKFEVSDRISRQGINLPSSVKLTEGDIKRVASVILG